MAGSDLMHSAEYLILGAAGGVLAAVNGVAADVGTYAGIGTAVIGLMLLVAQVVRRTIISTVTPLIDDVKEAGKAQHDAQNLVLTELSRKVTRLEQRHPSTRSRKDDHT